MQGDKICGLEPVKAEEGRKKNTFHIREPSSRSDKQKTGKGKGMETVVALLSDSG